MYDLYPQQTYTQNLGILKYRCSRTKNEVIMISKTYKSCECLVVGTQLIDMNHIKVVTT